MRAGREIAGVLGTLDTAGRKCALLQGVRKRRVAARLHVIGRHGGGGHHGFGARPRQQRTNDYDFLNRFGVGSRLWRGGLIGGVQRRCAKSLDRKK